MLIAESIKLLLRNKVHSRAIQLKKCDPTMRPKKSETLIPTLLAGSTGGRLVERVKALHVDRQRGFEKERAMERTLWNEADSRSFRSSNSSSVIVTTCTGTCVFFVARPFPSPLSTFVCRISPIEILGPTAAKSLAMSVRERREEMADSV